MLFFDIVGMAFATYQSAIHPDFYMAIIKNEYQIAIK